MKLIGLNGRLHSGKDTAYSAIAEYAQSSTVQRAAFADKIKYSGMLAIGFDPGNSVADMVSMADRLKSDGFITASWKIENVMVTNTVSGREFWQLYGTEAHRKVFGDDFWVDALLPQASGHPSRDSREVDNDIALCQRFPGANIVVVTDVRYPNETARILALGGVVWKIDAEERLGPLPADAHSSERGVNPEYLTGIIDNNGTEDEFKLAVRVAMAGL